MNRSLTYQVTAAAEGKKVGEFLRTQGCSRQVVTDLKKTENGILLNHEWVYVNTLLKTGDILTIQLEETVSSENIVPVEMELDIVYEDQDIIVVNKPSDLPIHPSQRHYEDTLANGLAYYYKEKNEFFTFRCVNRLDRDTSGLVLLAKNRLSSCILSAQILERRISRTYFAIVEGKIADSGIIDVPIGRRPGSTIERIVDFENGERAVTHFWRKGYEDGYSLAEVHLETGRTHQIRVHMKHIGHPLPGDFLYNPDYSKISRQPLHSFQLSFCHPITKEDMLFTAPLPDDFFMKLGNSSIT